MRAARTSKAMAYAFPEAREGFLPCPQAHCAARQGMPDSHTS